MLATKIRLSCGKFRRAKKVKSVESRQQEAQQQQQQHNNNVAKVKMPAHLAIAWPRVREFTAVNNCQPHILWSSCE